MIYNKPLLHLSNTLFQEFHFQLLQAKKGKRKKINNNNILQFHIYIVKCNFSQKHDNITLRERDTITAQKMQLNVHRKHKKPMIS